MVLFTGVTMRNIAGIALLKYGDILASRIPDVYGNFCSAFFEDV